MKLQIMNMDMLTFLKDSSCLEKCLTKYSTSDSGNWIYDICDKEPFIQTKYINIDDFELDMSEEDPFQTEFENVKRVYDHFKFLSNSNASEERLWSALCMGPFYKYVQYRWKIASTSNILQHFYFGYGSRRSLTRNAIARLWWIGRLTYDTKLDDPYELTKFVCKRSDYIMHFIERNTSNNICVMRPFLEAIMEAIESGYNINTDDAGELSKYLNLLGGTYILDFMSEDWIKSKISKKIEEIVYKSLIHEANLEVATVSEKVTYKGKIVAQRKDNGMKIIMAVNNNKFITEPKSLVGLKINDTFLIGKDKYTIVDIRK